MPARSAAGDADVTGESVFRCTNEFPCSDWQKRHFLSRITFNESATSTNTVAFAYIPGVNVDVCDPGVAGPSSCQPIGTGADRFVFTDGLANLYAYGLCSNIGLVPSRLVACQAPETNLYELAPANAVSSLPVAVILRGENDQFLSTIPPGVQEFAFFIDTGWGNDVVVLNDNSGHVYGGADQIFCGPGQDRVITNTDVTVAPDCENVTRLT